MIDGFYMEPLPDGECTISDAISVLKNGYYRSLNTAVETAAICLTSSSYLSDDEEYFLIRFLFDNTGVNYGS